MTKRMWRQIALSLTLIAVVSMTAYAQGGRGGRQGGGGPGGGGFFGGFGGGGSNAAQFALRTDVSKELDLDEDQKGELQDISSSAPGMREIMQDLDIDFRAMRDMSSEERTKMMTGVQKKMAKANQESAEKVLDVLTSKQKTRYRQLKFQYEISRGQAANALTVTDVDIDDVDQDELREAMQKASQKLNELRIKTYAAALGEVVGQSKIETLLADIFEFDARSGGAFGRGGGGQRGGGRAGGGGGGRPQRPGGGDGGENPRRRRPAADDADEQGQDDNPRRRRRE